MLADDRAIAEYFDAAVAVADSEKEVTLKHISNWITTQIFRLLSNSNLDITQIKIEPANLVALIKLVQDKTINQNAAKKVLDVMFENGRPPQELVKEMGLQQISDESSLLPIAQQVLADNPDAAAQFKSGKESIVNFLVGQVMRATRGKANPKLAEQVLREELQG